MEEHTIDMTHKYNPSNNIDEALQSSHATNPNIVHVDEGLGMAEQWMFVDVRTQKQLSTRQLIRAQAARKRTRSRYTATFQDVFTRFHTSREIAPVPQMSSEPVAFRQSRSCPMQDIYKSRARSARYGPGSVLGAGRIDPFKSSPSEHGSRQLDECFDFFVRVLLPELHPIDKGGVVNPLIKAWFPAAYASPLLFHSTILSASTSLDVLHRNNAHQSLRIYHEGEIVKELIRELNNPDTTYNYDEIIVAVSVLALDTGTILPLTDDSPFSPPLTSFAWVTIKGATTHNEMHSKAFYNLVKMRGGLHKLKMPYIAYIMSHTAIRDSTLSLRQSPFPHIPAFERPQRRTWSEDIISQYLKSRGLVLPRLAVLGFRPEVLELSYDLCELSIAIQEHCQKQVAMSKVDFMVYKDTRDAIQHRLISLPQLDFDPIYESYRFSLWIYSFAVTYGGAPFHKHIRKRVVSRLISALRKTKVEHDIKFCLFPEALLWILFMGGISAIGLPERVWFIGKVMSVLTLLELRDWTDVKDVLKSFLWLDIACDTGAEALYNEVVLLFLLDNN